MDSCPGDLQQGIEYRLSTEKIAIGASDMDIVIIGAGGHGKVVLDVLRAAGKDRPIAFIDADTSLTGTSIGGLPVIGPANMLPKLRQQKVRGAIIAIGDCRARMEYADLVREQGFELINAI